MRSNSGEKKNFQKEEGGGETRKVGEGEKKKTPPSRAQLFFFFLKRKSLESARFASRRPSPQPRSPPLSASDPGSVTSLIPPSSGFLLSCCCFLSGRKAGSTFSFQEREPEPALNPAAVSILSGSSFKLLQAPRTTYSFPSGRRRSAPLRKTGRARRLEIGKFGTHKAFNSRVPRLFFCWWFFFFFFFQLAGVGQGGWEGRG